MISCLTPDILLPWKLEEREVNIFHQELKRKVKNGVRVKYLFSLTHTLNDIKKHCKTIEEVKGLLKRWKKMLSDPTLDGISFHFYKNPLGPIENFLVSKHGLLLEFRGLFSGKICYSQKIINKDIIAGFIKRFEDSFNHPHTEKLTISTMKIIKSELTRTYKKEIYKREKKRKFLYPSFKLLGYLSERKLSKLHLGNLKPFSNCYFIIVLHFLRDLIPFLEALIKFGADPSKCYFICKPYPYAYKNLIKAELRKKGCSVYISSSPEEIIENVRLVLQILKKSLKTQNSYFIVVEDGGYVVPILHSEFSELLQFCMGAVEQTTKGIRRDKKVKAKKIPILNVAECRFKKEYEPPFVAEAIVRNIRNMLPDKNFAGEYACVVGFGSIGSKVVEALNKSLGMKVYVVEWNPAVLLRASTSSYVAKADSFPNELIPNSSLVIGATGGINNYGLGKYEISLLRHNSIIASASSDRDEIDVQELEWLAGDKPENRRNIFSKDGQKIGTEYTFERVDSRVVLLLADGYPINFYSSESIPNESFDPILTILFFSALKLMTGPKISPGIKTKVVDNIVKEEEIEKEVLRIYRGILVK
jgi:adenosylhomocysteinase